ncbi:MAG: transglutaminase domain-containing protein [Xanthobacteraceae bacterium]
MMIFTPYGLPEPGPAYLAPTRFLAFDDPLVRDFVSRVIGSETLPKRKAVRLFYAVRDEIRYDPFAIRLEPAAFEASTVVREGRSFCIPKAVLLAAAARAVGIPSALGLSDVVNHFTSDRLKRAMGGKEVFLHHGYAALYLDGRWMKVAPAFNVELCTRFGVLPTEFDGTADAVLQEYDARQNVRMEYLHHHGFWSDLPFTRIKEDFASYYPPSFCADGVADEPFVPLGTEATLAR